MQLEIALSLLLLLLVYSNGLFMDTMPEGRGERDPLPKDMRVFKHGHAPKVDKRIIGGGPIKPHDWPYLAVIVQLKPKNASDNPPPLDSTAIRPENYTLHQWCGATVLGRHHVLTAAHCFDDMDADGNIQYMVISGEHSVKMEEFYEQYSGIKDVIKHDNYISGQKAYDIAVVKLADSFALYEFTNKIDLNTDDSCPRRGAVCMTAGWGHTSNGGQFSDVPQGVMLPVRDDQACQAIYRQFGPDQPCAGAKGHDVCEGDAGDPLVCQCGGFWRLAGIASYGTKGKCGYKEYPSAFAKVSHVLDWIQRAMRQ